VVGKLILILLEIYCPLQQWKNFANPPRIDEVIAMVRVAPFLTHGVHVGEIQKTELNNSSKRTYVRNSQIMT